MLYRFVSKISHSFDFIVPLETDRHDAYSIIELKWYYKIDLSGEKPDRSNFLRKIVIRQNHCCIL